MFEVLSLFPLFPGTNELDQIQKIHNVLGTPAPEVLGKFKRSAHMNFNFPQKTGTGIEKLLPNGSPDAIDLIKKLLIYNPDERYSAGQALKHPYFREFREAEKGVKLSNPRQDAVLSQEASSEGSEDSDRLKPLDSTSTLSSNSGLIKKLNTNTTTTTSTNSTNVAKYSTLPILPKKDASGTIDNRSGVLPPIAKQMKHKSEITLKTVSKQTAALTLSAINPGKGKLPNKVKETN